MLNTFELSPEDEVRGIDDFQFSYRDLGLCSEMRRLVRLDGFSALATQNTPPLAKQKEVR
ncbi:MAG: hypothetical protein KJI72_02635 [Patescibacteria group bacterium]|nr:hypothetical protein [Patescibacteria group bacterium]